MKTLAIFTPYELITGGGTRYVLGIAEALRDVCCVYLVTPAEQRRSLIKGAAESIAVSADDVVPIGWEQAHARAPFTYSVVFGNEPLPLVPGIGERNVFVCQFPFPMNEDEDISLRLAYLSQYECIVVYSDYAERHLRARLQEFEAHAKPIRLIHPAADPIPPDRWLIRRKRNSILSVGRFFNIDHSKRQDELIGAFRTLNDAGWSLHLAGAIRFGGPHQAMYDECVRLAEGMSVQFHPNASRAEIGRLYRQSTCYWHGTGLGADPVTEPEKFEHFGITVVEAMAAGCLPMVVAHGGPTQIVTSGHDGWTYKTLDELIDLTLQLKPLHNELQIRDMRARARARARDFASDIFRMHWQALLSD